MRLLASTTMSVAAALFGPPSTARLGSDIEIRQAGGRGRGAFATRTLPAGEYLGRYTGRLMSPAEAFRAYEAGLTTGEYFASLGDAGDSEALIVDAEDERAAGWPRFVNHSKRRVQLTLALALALPLSLALALALALA